MRWKNPKNRGRRERKSKLDFTRWMSRMKKLTSPSCDSPVTPTVIRQNTQRVSAASIVLTSKVVAEDSDGFWSLCLTDEQKSACKEALEAIRLKLSRPQSIDREFLSLMTMNISRQELVGRLKAARCSINQEKNRYMDVLPFDDTRVVLQSTRASGDYINASFIEGGRNDDLPVFIATQGPLKSTVVDFWEMVMQHRCPIIVMLTSFLDGNMEKCAPYFPMAVNQHQSYGRIRVTNKSLTISSYSIAKRVFEVKSTERSRDPPLHVLHLEYLHWPDHGVPGSTRPIRELFRCISSITSDLGPFIVHCSAGIGRSGTYITIDHSLRRILKGDLTAVNIEDTVRHYRQQRTGMVQTKAQYHFCYAAIADELEDMLKLSP